MCQPKSKGGKRCLKHAKLSQFVTRYVKAKTGARDELISESMGELNREAKTQHVANATGREVSAFIDKQSLAIDMDQAIGSHDRKIMQNQLTAARDETKNGVDGNHFHVWKNLLGRVRSKMRKSVLALGLAGTLAIGISGCAAGINTGPSDSPRPTTSISATTQAPVTHLGDAIGTGITVTDSHGTYETTKLDPTDSVYKYDSNSVDASASKLFSKNDILAGQKFVVDFVSTQGVDSVALDNDTAGWNEWKKTEADKYLLPAYETELLKDKSNGDRSGLIFNDNRNETAVLARDGKPRIADETLKIDVINGFTSGSINGLSVQGSDVVTYRVTKKEAIATLLQNNPDITEAQLKKAYPNLYDANAANPTVQATLSFKYSIAKDSSGNWKIGGYDNNRQLNFANLK